MDLFFNIPGHESFWQRGCDSCLQADAPAVKDMVEAGIVEPYKVKHWGIMQATNAAVTVLRVDQVCTHMFTSHFHLLFCFTDPGKWKENMAALTRIKSLFQVFLHNFMTFLFSSTVSLTRYIPYMSRPVASLHQRIQLCCFPVSLWIM